MYNNGSCDALYLLYKIHAYVCHCYVYMYIFQKASALNRYCAVNSVSIQSYLGPYQYRHRHVIL